jgi:hypothetical protein
MFYIGWLGQIISVNCTVKIHVSMINYKPFLQDREVSSANVAT